MSKCRDAFNRWRLIGVLALLVLMVGVFVLFKTKMLAWISIDMKPSITSPLSLPFSTSDLCFDPSGEHLLLVHDGTIDIRNLPDGSQATSLGNPGDPFTRLICAREGSVGYCLTEKGKIKRLDLTTHTLCDETSFDASGLIDLAVTSKSQLIAAVTVDGTITVTNLADRRSLLRRELSWDPTLTAISADGEFIAMTGHWRPTFHILGLTGNDKNTDEQIHDLGKGTWVDSIHFCGRSHVLAVGLKILIGPARLESGVLLWDCDSNRELDRLQPFPSGAEIYSMTSSDDGQLLVFGFHYDLILICTTNPLRIVKELSAYDESSIEAWRSQQPSRDSSMWEERPLEPRRHSRSSAVPKLRAAVTRLTLSPDGRSLASHAVIGIDDNPGYGEVKVWSLDKILANQE